MLFVLRFVLVLKTNKGRKKKLKKGDLWQSEIIHDWRDQEFSPGRNGKLVLSPEALRTVDGNRCENSKRD
ncbi:hypothetical protein GDO81_009255 [Engystomops pustulosus]|uniref:Uncharacterized protein n=1 Tax=Engystomops pustulosus TaxID=76066 RepID=A0AAV7BQG2_ENGPU|nr:hypothetical protein GDO81_009255 [Engystomops pustulosus]